MLQKKVNIEYSQGQVVLELWQTLITSISAKFYVEFLEMIELNISGL